MTEPRTHFLRILIANERKDRLAIDEHRAFELMRSQSQRSGQRLFDIAKAVVDSHLLLVPPGRTTP